MLKSPMARAVALFDELAPESGEVSALLCNLGANALWRNDLEAAERLADRGVLAVGMIADINIFHADTVTDFDDWSHPHRYAAGFEYVLVNGVPVIDAGARSPAFPGRVLKRGP